MYPEVFKISKFPGKTSAVFLTSAPASLPAGFFSREEISYILQRNKKEKQEFFSFNRLTHWYFVQIFGKEENIFRKKEEIRKSGDRFGDLLNEQKEKTITLYDAAGLPDETLAFAEGLVLGQYSFQKYRGKKGQEKRLDKVMIFSLKAGDREVRELAVVTTAVFNCRTLINEPNSYLTATVFAKEVQKMATSCGAKSEILSKKKIEALQMGGLLAVNKGSEMPPTFTIMEWKPKKPVNNKPIVFVGKGIVFDSGGMNLKPGDSMNTMKDDMSGAAAVASAIYAIATAELPVHVIGLMPATDNRPGPNAIVPGDIITMQNGMTVEVLNTDAEGRLILADALNHAAKYNPSLVIDLATLTGSAIRAVGKIGIVAMQSKAEKEIEILKKSSWKTYERLVEFPSWDEYSELLKSDLADLKNVGPAEAGAITAGIFLEKFTSYPFIHLDIAGPAFLEKKDSYRGKGGTGVGVRLLFEFVKNIGKQ